MLHVACTMRAAFRMHERIQARGASIQQCGHEERSRNVVCGILNVSVRARTSRVMVRGGRGLDGVGASR